MDQREKVGRGHFHIKETSNLEYGSDRNDKLESPIKEALERTEESFRFSDGARCLESRVREKIR